MCNLEENVGELTYEYDLEDDCDMIKSECHEVKDTMNSVAYTKR